MAAESAPAAMLPPSCLAAPGVLDAIDAVDTAACFVTISYFSLEAPEGSISAGPVLALTTHT